MASIGKAKVLIGLFCIMTFLPFSCSRGQKSSPPVVVSKAFSFAHDQVPALLSGVWYHTRGEQMNKPIEMEFSWGKTTIGYWNALVIDLLDGKQLIGEADGGWDRVTYEFDRSNPDLLHMHLGLSNGPGEEASIEVITKDEIVFNFATANGAYYKMVNGTYYKSFDPGESAQAK